MIASAGFKMPSFLFEIQTSLNNSVGKKLTESDLLQGNLPLSDELHAFQRLSESLSLIKELKMGSRILVLQYSSLITQME